VRPPLVFVGSVSQDFARERVRIRRALRPAYEAYLYEPDVARDTAPEQHLQDVLAESEVYVGLHGRRYGSPYTGDASGRSIVEWEADVAVSKGKPVLHFVRVPLTDVEPEQKRFLDRIRGFDVHWCKEFVDSPRSRVLVRMVRAAIEVSFTVRVRQLEDDRLRLLGRARLGLRVAAAAVQVGVCLAACAGAMTIVDAAAANVAVLAATEGIRLLVGPDR
jgi:hypothetical protein